MNDYIVFYENVFTKNLHGRNIAADCAEKAIEECSDIDRHTYKLIGVVRCEELL